ALVLRLRHGTDGLRRVRQRDRPERRLQRDVGLAGRAAAGPRELRRRGEQLLHGRGWLLHADDRQVRSRALTPATKRTSTERALHRLFDIGTKGAFALG